MGKPDRYLIFQADIEICNVFPVLGRSKKQSEEAYLMFYCVLLDFISQWSNQNNFFFYKVIPGPLWIRAGCFIISFFDLFMALFEGQGRQSARGNREREKGMTRRATGRNKPGPLQWGHCLHAWDTRSNNWATGVPQDRLFWVPFQFYLNESESIYCEVIFTVVRNCFYQVKNKSKRHIATTYRKCKSECKGRGERFQYNIIRELNCKSLIPSMCGSTWSVNIPNCIICVLYMFTWKDFMQ